MGDDTSSEKDGGGIGGKLRQMLHAASGDRAAEAKALADRSGGEVSEAEALVAVERAHGELRDEEAEGVELATVGDAQAAAGADEATVKDAAAAGGVEPPDRHDT
jgi:hypothetical protein